MMSQNLASLAGYLDVCTFTQLEAHAREDPDGDTELEARAREDRDGDTELEARAREDPDGATELEAHARDTEVKEDNM